ncbi:Putative holo-[acyl-carrier-protein] synthase [Mycobacteroides abscessus subsp. abscessus]|nr:Putative holo-[acyl-carrier-protein] synthase [Mycobacteroides abscessus subsp. abscessus]
MLPENIHRDIEVVTDTWGRPRIRLSGAIGEYLADMTMHVTLTHDGDTAAAFVVLEQEDQPSST